MSWFRSRSEVAQGGTPAAVHGSLEMHKPWARCASRGQPEAIAAAYLSIVNKGQDHDRLLGASSPLAEKVELCGIKVVGAGIAMRPLAGGLSIHARYTTTLKPRGYHLLLQGLKAPLARGSTLPVTLTFATAGAVDIAFVVEEPGLIGAAILNEEHHRG